MLVRIILPHFTDEESKERWKSCLLQPCEEQVAEPVLTQVCQASESEHLTTLQSWLTFVYRINTIINSH